MELLGEDLRDDGDQENGPQDQRADQVAQVHLTRRRHRHRFRQGWCKKIQTIQKVKVTVGPTLWPLLSIAVGRFLRAAFKSPKDNRARTVTRRSVKGGLNQLVAGEPVADFEGRGVFGVGAVDGVL